MTPLPPGLDDESIRRYLLVAVDRKQQQLRRDGLVPPPAFAEFAAWLENVTVMLVEQAQLEHVRALSRASSQRHRDRLAEERASAT